MPGAPRDPRKSLVRAFGEAVDHAERSARDAKRAPARAVHEYRKSLRRARALLRLARPVLSAPRRRGLGEDLARAARETSSLRDAHVLHETLRGMPDRRKTRIVRGRIAASLRKKEAAALAAAPRTLARAAGRLARAGERFDSALQPRVAWDDLERALRTSHHRLRRATRRAIDRRADEDVHALRKRIKELRYELEMLAASGAARVEAERDTFARLAESLGEVTDLMILAEHVIAWKATADANAGADALLANIRRAIQKRLARVLRRVARALAARPRRFAAKVVEAARSTNRRRPPEEPAARAS